MSGGFEWTLVPQLPLDAFFTEVIGQAPDKIIVPEERFWKEFAPKYYSAANWETIHAKLKLGAALDWTSFLTEEIVSCLVNMDGSSRGFQNLVQKKKQLWPWQKDLIAKR